MKHRASYGKTRYMSLPPEQRPAMSTVDAIGLYQEFVHSREEVPEEVRLEAMRQANEGVPEGFVTLLEEYQGRVRAVTIKK